MKQLFSLIPKKAFGRLIQTASVAAAAAVLSACAPQQAGYKPTGPGVVDVMVPYASGGGTDTWARFITQAFADVNPDVKRYQVVNVPGGETITGTNAFVKSGVKTGQYVMVGSATTYFQDMLNHKAAKFDFAEMEPLAFNGTGGVVWTSGKSGIKNIGDLKNAREPWLYGGMSASGLDLIALLALEALGVPNRGVFGFEGRGPSRLAVQRGETDLDFQTTAAYLSQLADDVPSGKVVPLFSMGIPIDGKIERDPNLPDIPTFDELYRQIGGQTEHQRMAYQAFQAFVATGLYYQKGLWANAGTGAEVADQYDAMVKTLNADPQFAEKAKAALGGYQLISGKAAKQDFQTALQLSPQVMDFVAKLLLDKYGTAIH
ncbi:hypothetical protein [Neisseria leonii]|uniref:hypothetical protein n=1 Tax=Neisseria leonii TaxID=2995413 RepID=UPI00237B2520|nr:hypothetical protein [Neisseria sp. 3986]MDD9325036.1 hypothetical protein [Neisseria sp. 3986]